MTINTDCARSITYHGNEVYMRGQMESTKKEVSKVITNTSKQIESYVE